MSISIDRLNTVCRTYVMPKLIDNIHRTGPLVFKLLKKPKKFVGSYFEVPVGYAKNSNAEFYAANATLTVSTVETMTKAQYSPVRANVGITLEGLDMALNQGEAKVLSLVKEEVKIAEKSLKELFSSDLFNTTQSNAITGLHSICAADGGSGSSLGGISGGPNGDATEWLSSSGSLGNANGPDSSTTSLTKLVLDKHYNSCIVDNSEPDLLITTYDIWSGISATHLQPNMRYTDGKMAEAGFENFKYRKALAFADSQCNAGDLFFLNSEDLFFAIVPGYNFKFIDFEYPHNKDQATAHVRWYGNLICGQRRTQGWMSAITGVA